MCGIVGFRSDSLDIVDLEGMMECVSHRGPDSDGTYQDGKFALGHRRLSIIDLSTGDQPIFNEDGTVCTIFNGEIYNYQQLRADLKGSGHSFSTDTDTEVLVHLYEEEGPDFVKHLEGMFAFALWDGESERLILARDRMGVKPLLIAEDAESVAFASELPALLAADVSHGGLDDRGLSLYFAFGQIPAPHTAFRNIRKLKPGERVIISENDVQSDSYYTPSVQSREIDFPAASAELRTRVTNGIEKRLMSDVPLGAFLSGGIDSSIVAGTMARLSDDPVKTFTVGFEEDRFDESWAAREVAEYNGTDHTTYTVTPDDVREAVPSVLNRLGEPFADQSLVPTYVVARETSNDVKVALSGDGADELFAGYTRYRGEYFSKFYRKLPRVIKTGVIETLLGRMQTSRSTRRGELIRKAQKFTRADVSEASERHFQLVRIPDSHAVQAFDRIDPEVAGAEKMRDEHTRAKAILPVDRHDALSTIMLVDTRFGLPNQILPKSDFASMYNSLEVRVPFLDKSVVEFAMSLPIEYKITPTKQKRILRRAFDEELPESIISRAKQGFDMPIGEWFRSELADEFHSTLHSIETDLIDPSEVDSIFKEHQTGSHNHGDFLWSVYVFTKWLSRMKRAGVID